MLGGIVGTSLRTDPQIPRERVVSFSSIECVMAVLTVELVIAGSARQHIIAEDSKQRVVPLTAIERVSPAVRWISTDCRGRVPNQCVAALPSDEHVAASPAAKLVRIIPTIQIVIGTKSMPLIVAIVALKIISSRPAEEHILAEVADQGVISLATIQEIIVRPGPYLSDLQLHIISLEIVVTSPTEQVVSPSLAEQHIVALPAIQYVITTLGIGKLAGPVQPIPFDPAEQLIVPIPSTQVVIAFLSVDFVVALMADHHVVARQRMDHIVRQPVTAIHIPQSGKDGAGALIWIDPEKLRPGGKPIVIRDGGNFKEANAESPALIVLDRQRPRSGHDQIVALFGQRDGAVGTLKNIVWIVGQPQPPNQYLPIELHGASTIRIFNRVGAIARADNIRIVAGAATQNVVIQATVERVVASPTVQDIIALPTHDDISPITAAQQDIVALVALDIVRTPSTLNRILAITPIKPIAPDDTAIDNFIHRIPKSNLGERCTTHSNFVTALIIFVIGR